MYKIDRRGGVQKSFTRTDPKHFNVQIKATNDILTLVILLHKNLPQKLLKFKKYATNK